MLRADGLEVEANHGKLFIFCDFTFGDDLFDEAYEQVKGRLRIMAVVVDEVVDFELHDPLQRLKRDIPARCERSQCLEALEGVLYHFAVLPSAGGVAVCGPLELELDAVVGEGDDLFEAQIEYAEVFCLDLTLLHLV